MQGLRHFSIPIKGLDYEKHTYSFVLNQAYFEAFDDSPISEGQLESNLELDKKHDHLVLDFKTKGTVKTECDRCTALIDLPIESELSFIVKYDVNEREEDEVVFIHPESHELNMAQFIYEQIILSLPLIKVFDCDDVEPLPCNQEILNILDQEIEDKEVVETINNPLGDALKNLKITKTK